MKNLSRILAIAVTSAVNCAAPEMKAWETLENSSGTTQPSAPPLPDSTEDAYWHPSFGPRQYPPPYHSLMEGNNPGTNIYPNLENIEEDEINALGHPPPYPPPSYNSLMEGNNPGINIYQNLENIEEDEINALGHPPPYPPPPYHSLMEGNNPGTNIYPNLENIEEDETNALRHPPPPYHSLEEGNRKAGMTGDSNQDELDLLGYLCELVLEVTGQSITYAKATNVVSSDELDTLLRRALESSKHREIRWILLAGQHLGEVFKAVDDSSGVSTSFKRLSADESSKGFVESTISETFFFMLVELVRLESLTNRHSVLEKRYIMLGRAALAATVATLMLLAYLQYCTRRSVSRKNP